MKSNNIPIHGKIWKGMKSFLSWGLVLLGINVISLAIFDKTHENFILTYLSIVLWVFALCIWIIAIVELKRKGEVEKGNSYMQTNKVVDTGVFRVFRHPQYIAYILFNIGIVIYISNWIVFLLGLFSCICLIIGMKEEEKLMVQKFGAHYSNYIQEVARVNLFNRNFRS